MTRPGRETWTPDGYVAYSKVCTHAGCPVGLYQEQLHQLLCPCHQSLFDVLDGAKPVFGPAPRPLPQLPLYDRRRRVHAGPGRLRRAHRPRLLGAVVTTTTPAVRRSTNGAGNGLGQRQAAGQEQARRGDRPLARRPPGCGQGRPRPCSTRSSPTTGRSCWARSPSTPSSSCWPPASSSRSTSSPRRPQVIYHGSYLPAAGRPHVGGLRVALDLSFAVRSGLVIRQMHHWAADVFVGAIAVHMARIFFTGAFRKPRELNWFIGVTLLPLAIVNGFLGYSLPDDLVSGTGIRIAYSIMLSIPVVGSYLASFVFGGHFPGNGSSSPASSSSTSWSSRDHSWACIGGHLACWSSRSTPSSPATAAPSRTWSARPCTRPSS